MPSPLRPGRACASSTEASRVRSRATTLRATGLRRTSAPNTLSLGEAKGRAITEHATTRLDAAVAAGRLMPLEAAERRFQVQERVREAASVARQRLHAAIDSQSRLKRG